MHLPIPLSVTELVLSVGHIIDSFPVLVWREFPLAMGLSFPGKAGAARSCELVRLPTFHSLGGMLLHLYMICSCPASDCCLLFSEALCVFSLNGSVFLLQNCREHLGLHPCDRRGKVSQLKEIYPAVDFSLVSFNFPRQSEL